MTPSLKMNGQSPRSKKSLQDLGRHPVLSKNFLNVVCLNSSGRFTWSSTNVDHNPDKNDGKKKKMLFLLILNKDTINMTVIFRLNT